MSTYKKIKSTNTQKLNIELIGVCPVCKQTNKINDDTSKSV